MRRLQKRPGGIHRTNLYRRGRRGGRQLSQDELTSRLLQSPQLAAGNAAGWPLLSACLSPLPLAREDREWIWANGDEIKEGLGLLMAEEGDWWETVGEGSGMVMAVVHAGEMVLGPTGGMGGFVLELALAEMLLQAREGSCWSWLWLKCCCRNVAATCDGWYRNVAATCDGWYRNVAATCDGWYRNVAATCDGWYRNVAATCDGWYRNVAATCDGWYRNVAATCDGWYRNVAATCDGWYRNVAATCDGWGPFVSELALAEMLLQVSFDDGGERMELAGAGVSELADFLVD
ncbi:unnamed protein product [Closterium sp. NIES-65]|nr:unnamed protein product [Closterium sp. NIES-65]